MSLPSETRLTALGLHTAWARAGAAAIAALLLLILFPAIDLAASTVFYRPGEGFPLEHEPLFRLVMKGLPDIVIGATVVAAVLGLVAAISGRVWFSATPRRALYLLVSLIIGPGLLVNTLFKDHWGRARPHQIVEFGGTTHFSPAFLLSDQCVRNCSFASGHAALAFWVIAFALLAPARWRPWAVAGALATGALVGLMRIAQGAHFLSDVLAAAILVVGVNLILKRLILDPKMRIK